jgi:hypothetical protein
MLRRSFLKGLAATLFIAPSIVRAENLMKIKEYMPEVPAWCPQGFLPMDGREINKKYYPDLFETYNRCKFPMRLNDIQSYTPITSYEVANFGFKPGRTKIVSYQNLKRSNGSIVPAGMISDFIIPDHLGKDWVKK